MLGHGTHSAVAAPGRPLSMTFAFPSHDPLAPSSLSPRKPTGWTVATVLLSLVLVFASVRLAGSGQVLDRIRALDTRWVLVSFALAVLQLALLGLRWSKVAASLGVELGWLRATNEYALSVLVNQVLPTGFAGDGLRGLRQTQRSNHGARLSFEALVLDRASGQLALWFLALLGAPFCVVAGVVSAATALSALLGLGAFASGGWWAVFHLPVLAPLMAGVRPSLRRAAGVLFSSRAAVHFPLSLLLVGCSALQLFVAARALGVVLTWPESCWLSPLILLAASLPCFVGGWGIREGASGVLFGVVGLSSSTGVAVSLVFGAFALVCALPGILVLLFEGRVALRGPVKTAVATGWGEAHALAMLSATAMALPLSLPVLPTAIGVASLMILVAQSRGVWTPSGSFGLANGVTTLRLFMTLGLVVAPQRLPGYILALIALSILGLDLVDGWLARRRAGHGPFGARYDMEVDALFVLSLSAALWSRDVAGVWVLLAGLWRYLFVVVPLLVPSRGGEAPRSLIYRSAYAVMVICFLLALLLPAGLGRWPALFGTFLLSASFLRSFWYRYLPRAGARGGA